MSRKPILTCVAALVLASSATAYAKGADDPSTKDAPFAGNTKSSSPAPFAASPSAGFAAMGQWVLTMRTTGDEGFFFRKPSGGDWQLSLHPSLDYFIINSVSLGAAFGYFYSPADTGTTVVSVGGRAGFNLNINDNLGFWPTAGVGLTFDSRDHGNDTTTFFGIFAPFLYHLVPHLFVGLGPSFSMQLDGGSKVYDVDFVLGGWL